MGQVRPLPPLPPSILADKALRSLCAFYRTAIVWNSSFEQVQALEGHSQTVWTVKSISPTQILTGSADKTIILWTKSGDKYTQTMKVRSIVLCAA